jgi:hypothetical protein
VRLSAAETGKKPGNSSEQSYSLVTTADAKIPLSVVQVKHEPQDVVFSSACIAPTWATPENGCAKR